MSNDKFFDTLYYVTEPASAIDMVMEHISNLMDGLDWVQFNKSMEDMGGPPLFKVEVGEPKFSEVNALLEQANPWMMPDSVSLCFLVMTWKSQNKYPAYKDYLEKCRARYLETGTKKRANYLLKGFELNE